MRLIDADKMKQHFAWWHEGGEEADRQAEIFEQIIDVQPTFSIEQLKWERDTAIQQLRELGYELGQEPKKGKWLPEESNSPLPTLWWRCSVCNGRTFAVEFDKPPLCPHCGARMEVDDAGDL